MTTFLKPNMCLKTAVLSSKAVHPRFHFLVIPLFYIYSPDSNWLDQSLHLLRLMQHNSRKWRLAI